MSARAFRSTGGVVAALFLASCADPTGSDTVVSASESRARERGLTPASIEWNEVARGLVAKNLSNVFVAFRAYATLSVAQYDAVLAAERASSEGNYVSRRAAVAAASAQALRYIYPADSATLRALLRQQVGSPEWLEAGGTDAATGETVGRRAGEQAVDRAMTDGYFAPWTGTVPAGDGFWFSSANPPAPPGGAVIGQARTFFLTSGDQFRPPPPPAFGSPEFLAALTEVRQVSDTRTRVQDSIAKFWAFGAGTFHPPGYWNLEASTLAGRERWSERRTAHLLALMNMVAMDAIIASHDAKYAYWLIRPWQADPAITLSVPAPNFPSYPANHATISAAMAEVLAAAFPGQAARLRELADQAAMSRLYGGIHYRFDNDAGLQLGRAIARYALELEAYPR
ncbi:MAG: vanadium-dependent haloperoxidase [Gemmatimonadaceae bacterium]